MFFDGFWWIGAVFDGYLAAFQSSRDRAAVHSLMESVRTSVPACSIHGPQDFQALEALNSQRIDEVIQMGKTIIKFKQRHKPPMTGNGF